RFFSFFFFQAEDGIRAGHVTGVQTCALPICGRDRARTAAGSVRDLRTHCDAPRNASEDREQIRQRSALGHVHLHASGVERNASRSEERRVGKEEVLRSWSWEYIEA